jgi:hypothetical protein
VRFCPYCGQPLGSFFGARIEGDGACCDRCQECFRVQHVEDIEDTISTSARSAAGDQVTGEP